MGLAETREELVDSLQEGVPDLMNEVPVAKVGGILAMPRRGSKRWASAICQRATPTASMEKPESDPPRTPLFPAQEPRRGKYG